eukprot:2276460-Rhodomonas_salina.1
MLLAALVDAYIRSACIRMTQACRCPADELSLSFPIRLGGIQACSRYTPTPLSCICCRASSARPSTFTETEHRGARKCQNSCFMTSEPSPTRNPGASAYVLHSAIPRCHIRILTIGGLVLAPASCHHNPNCCNGGTSFMSDSQLVSKLKRRQVLPLADCTMPHSCRTICIARRV